MIELQPNNPRRERSGQMMATASNNVPNIATKSGFNRFFLCWTENWRRLGKLIMIDVFGSVWLSITVKN